MVGTGPYFTVPWRVRDAIMAIVGMYVSFFGLVMVYGVVLSAGFSAQGLTFTSPEAYFDLLVKGLADSPWTEVWFLIQALLMVLFMQLLVFRPQGVSPRILVQPGHAVSDASYAIKLFLAAIFLSAFIVGAIVGSVLLFGRLGGADPELLVKGYLQGLERESQTILTPAVEWNRLVLVILVAPVVEELLYRGCLYGALRKRFKPWTANLISSAIFGVSHNYAFGLPNILIIGVLGAYAFEKTRSLRASMIFHALWNIGCAAAVRHELLIVLVLGLPVVGIWIHMRLKTDWGRIHRVWWKIYAGLFIGSSIWEYFSQGTSWWLLPLEVPLWAGLIAYAVNRRPGSPTFWKTYLGVFMLWLLGEWHATLVPETEQGFWQRLLTGGEHIVLTGPEELMFYLLIAAVLVGPALVVLYRLASSRPKQT